MIKGRPSDIYRHRVATGVLTTSAQQMDLLKSIDDFYCSLHQSEREHQNSLSERVFDLAERLGLRFQRRARTPVPETKSAGLYLYGSVGRGKSQLMHILRQSLPAQWTAYYHFHELMNRVHQQLNALDSEANPLPLVAQRLAAQCRVLFVDEFFVVDIADAMIMSGLLHALFENGVSLVTTSNFAPDDLYRDGLQRARFMPAIEMIKSRMTLLEFSSGIDYRCAKLADQPIFICASDVNAGAQLADIYTTLTDKVVQADNITVAGRTFAVSSAAPGLVWFQFRILCGANRSRQDYRELAQTYPLIIIDGLHAMDDTNNDVVRRFIYLIDILYENMVKIILSSQVEVDDLYSGERLHHEFKRTRSRIVEMCSPDWLALPHLCAPTPITPKAILEQWQPPDQSNALVGDLKAQGSQSHPRVS